MTHSTCAALFDLDGVLIDSESVYSRFWTEIDRIYPTGIPNYALHIKGTTLPEILKDFPDEDVQKDILRRISEFQDVMHYELFQGVEHFLESLAAKGIPAAIVTSSDSRKMQMLFSQLPEFKRYFEAIIDASQVTRSKPDPQGYLMAASQLDCDPSDCYVFEDSFSGREAARRSGAKVIALSTTNTADLLKDKADKVISSFNQLSVDKLLER